MAGETRQPSLKLAECTTQLTVSTLTTAGGCRAALNHGSVERPKTDSLRQAAAALVRKYTKRKLRIQEVVSYTELTV